MHPGRIIKLLRTAEEISQFDLAQKLNVSRPYLSQVENGKKEPGLVFLREAARVLNVPVALLLMDEAAPETEITNELRKILAHVLSAKMKRKKNGEDEEKAEIAQTS